MKNISFPHLLLGGIVAYAIMYLLWGVFSQFEFSGAIARLVGFAVLAVTMIILTRATKRDTVVAMLPYAAFWVATVAALDVVLAVPYTGWVLFSDLGLWLGYAVIFFVPLAVAAQEDSTGEAGR